MSEEKQPSPIDRELEEMDVRSAVAVAGHPVHAMSVHFPIAFIFGTLGADMLYWWSADPFWVRASIWTAGFAFISGVAAGFAGTAELLLVHGIRNRVQSWAHGVAAMTLLSAAGLNWGVRLTDPASVLPHGLFLSILSALLAGLAGWHGGKLIFHHGIGLMISAKD